MPAVGQSNGSIRQRNDDEGRRQRRRLDGQLRCDRAEKLIGAQCSGILLLAKLGLLGKIPACTDLMTKPWVQVVGVDVAARV